MLMIGNEGIGAMATGGGMWTEDVDAESPEGGGRVGANRGGAILGLEGPAVFEADAETPRYRRIVGVRGAENLCG